MLNSGEKDPTVAGGGVAVSAGETLRVKNSRIGTVNNRCAIDGRLVVDGLVRPELSETSTNYALLDSNVSVGSSEVVVVQMLVPGNTCKIGSTFKLEVFGRASSSSVATMNVYVRFGTAGTTADTQVTPSRASVTPLNGPFIFTAVVTCQSPKLWMANAFFQVGTNSSSSTARTAAVAASSIYVDNWISFTADVNAAATVTNAFIELSP